MRIREIAIRDGMAVSLRHFDHEILGRNTLYTAKVGTRVVRIGERDGEEWFFAEGPNSWAEPVVIRVLRRKRDQIVEYPLLGNVTVPSWVLLDYFQSILGDEDEF